MLKLFQKSRDKHTAYIQTSKPTVGISGEVIFTVVSYRLEKFCSLNTSENYIVVCIQKKIETLILQSKIIVH